ncbi:RGAP1-like protein [Mya arenaria]|uniref:RGAP1-like protein n=1 Tax=Mya arenaria TaxID=6604 RepID=A0ABY7DFC6_MYAAR|nr:RGAP1-like protein [Mya arenaria]
MSSKLSLVAAFDELKRNTDVLSAGIEQEFSTFAEHQQSCRRQWATAEDELLRERQIALIRELLVDSKSGNQLDQYARERLAFLSSTNHTTRYEDSPLKQNRRSMNNQSQHSVLSDEDIDYWDKTEEDVISPCNQRRRSKRIAKRPSAPPEEDMNITPPKRQRGYNLENEVVTTTTITVTADGRPIEATTEVSVPSTGRKSGGARTLNKSFSEPCLDKHLTESEIDSDLDPWTPRADNRNTNGIKSNMRTPSTPSLRKTNSASRGLNRIHFFISETVIRPRTCVPGVLGDYCRDECPMIPGIVIHCVNEIEARGLNEVGIYRVPGSDRQVKELKEKFLRGKGMPNLSSIDDVHVVCGCLKDFLRNLKEPLVTFKLWKMFVHAAECEMFQAISELPRANRDTIAFLMIHLHRVSETPACKMPANNLSRVFGPTLVGHSVPDPEPSQLISETKYQAMVMDRLFEIPEDYWINFISDEQENMFRAGEVNTPVNTPEISRAGHVVKPAFISKT